MRRLLRVALGLPAVMFILIGIQWLVVPRDAAEGLGMPLLENLGRSSQIGDMAAFFLTLGLSALIGSITQDRRWFYPSVMLLSIAAFSRLIAWLLHDASLASDFIAFELIIAAFFWFGSSYVAPEVPSNNAADEA